ncbi:MAG TPA: MurR/RpiR family transcriptional regulator [Thermoanaerobaculia bacterium]|nr:MurR/RpiR family transcriptional regulator [Thermoanaerobaculia bacterium]
MSAPYALLQRLSPRWGEIIRPVFEQPRRFVLLTVRALAEELGSDPATTLRIVKRLGFGRYRDFQHYLHELSIANATSLDRMRTAPSTRDPASAIVETLELDLANLRTLREHIDTTRLIAVAERLHQADRIAIFGGDLAVSLVHYLSYHLAILGLPCLTATTPGQTVHLTRTLGPGDLVIAISLGRGLRQTVEGLARAHANGAYCVGIANNVISPINRHADETFVVASETHSFGESYAAPMALLNALQRACAHARLERTLELLEDAAQEQRFGYRWHAEE